MFSQFTISFQMSAPGLWKEETSSQGKKQSNIHNNFCGKSRGQKRKKSRIVLWNGDFKAKGKESTFLLTTTHDHVPRWHLADMQARYWCFDKAKQVGLLFHSALANDTWNWHKGKKNRKKLSEEAGRRNSMCISKQTIHRKKNQNGFPVQLMENVLRLFLT